MKKVKSVINAHEDKLGVFFKLWIEREDGLGNGITFDSKPSIEQIQLAADGLNGGPCEVIHEFDSIN